MSTPLHNALKKEFQLERLILFSDAVFAIAITLLVIEIKIPELHDEISDDKLLSELKHLIPKFLGFILSFVFIGLFWTIHHRMFGFVTNYTRRLIFLNLLFLFSIATMPFSNGIYGEFSGTDKVMLATPVIIYNLNIIFTGLVSFFIWAYICNPKNKVADELPDKADIRKFKARSLVIPAVFALSLLVTYFNPLAARYVYLLIPVIMRFFRTNPKKNK